jgi:hypothetical protein
MALDHAGDFVAGTNLAGVLGLAILAVHAVLGRRWRAGHADLARDVVSAEWLGAAAAALGAVGLSLAGLDQELVGDTSGTGQLFSIAVAALLAAGFLVGRRTHAGRLLGR